MSFRNLVEPECGNQSSLLHLTTHYMRDHGFSEEGIHQQLVLPEINQLQTLNANQLTSEFVAQSPYPQTFRMHEMLQQMREIENVCAPITAPIIAKDSTGLHTNWVNEHLQENISRNSLMNMEKHANEVGSELTMQPAQGMNMHFPRMHLPNMSLPKMHLPGTSKVSVDPKWAEGYIEEDIDAMQDDINETNDVNSTTKQQESNTPPLLDLENITEEPIKGILFDDDTCQEYTEENTILNEVEAQLAAAGTGWPEKECTKDSQEMKDLNSSTSSQIEEDWNNVWETLTNEEMDSDSSYQSDFDDKCKISDVYEFCKENPMKDLPNALEEGKKQLEKGDLPSAVLCFEAAVQQQGHENNPEAWLLLGKTQAENERDILAIPALKHCLKLDPINNDALMSLAVCYTNEYYRTQACQMLREWLLKNEKYKHLSDIRSKDLDQKPESMLSTTYYEFLYKDVEKLFLKAARMNPRDKIDPDIQCGLGVLFNLSEQYDKAIDCFRVALQIRPLDSRIWNKLAASFANGHRSAEAINAYRRALQLSPGFVRARYNLGICCINLGAYKQGAEQLLIALNQQAAGRSVHPGVTQTNAMSESIWSSLRMAISFMRKYHLIRDVEEKNLLKLNKEFEIM